MDPTRVPEACGDTTPHAEGKGSGARKGETDAREILEARVELNSLDHPGTVQVKGKPGPLSSKGVRGCVADARTQEELSSAPHAPGSASDGSPVFVATEEGKRRRTRTTSFAEERSDTVVRAQMAREYDSEGGEELVIRKRGRPPTTGDFVGRAVVQERLNAAKREELRIQEDFVFLNLVKGAISDEPDMDLDTDNWTQEEDDLASQMKNASTADVASAILKILEAVAVTGRKSKNLKGTMQHTLKMAHKNGRIVVMELMARAEGACPAPACSPATDPAPTPAPAPALAPAPTPSLDDERRERELAELRERVAFLEGRAGDGWGNSSRMDDPVVAAQYSGSPVRRSSKRPRRGDTTSPLPIPPRTMWVGMTACWRRRWRPLAMFCQRRRLPRRAHSPGGRMGKRASPFRGGRLHKRVGRWMVALDGSSVHVRREGK